jgi:hydroxybutyrate-dimer hydrolase
LTPPDDARIARRPDFLVGPVHVRVLDGETDDLLTGGRGASGLADPIPPVFADPTPENRRRSALHRNYRGLIDASPGGGYGRFFGPTVGGDLRRDGRIPGREYLALSDDGSGTERVALMVQVPESFRVETGALVATASSGSRGIYGAVGVTGEWALKRGFAVAYTDKGTGVGVHDLQRDRSADLTGAWTNADDPEVLFRAFGDDDDLARFRREFPGRVAVKHAHSGRNPEAFWGLYLLRAIRFAFHVLNRPELRGSGPTVTPARLPTIAAGISNGGAAALRALEADREGMIRAAVASEPNVQPRPESSLVLRQGDREWRTPNHSRSLLDVHTLLHLYQPTVLLLPELAGAPFHLLDPGLCRNRTREMVRRGLLPDGDPDRIAAAARSRLRERGILPDADILAPAHVAFGISEAIAVTYANAYGKFGVADRLAGYTMAALGPDLSPRSPDPELLASLFATGAGIPPMPALPLSDAQTETLTRLLPEMRVPAPPVGGIDLVNERSLGGPVASRYSVSRSGIRDLNLDAALELRRLATGRDESGTPPAGPEASAHDRIARGIEAVRAGGDLGGRPAIVVHGRADAILPPNHTSRPYRGLNRLVEGGRSRLRYVEVVHAHHMDAFNALPGFDARFVPLHLYFIRALDWIWDHLRTGRALPPDQVVRTRPRGTDGQGVAPPLESIHVPDIQARPAEANRIRFRENLIQVPD